MQVILQNTDLESALNQDKDVNEREEDEEAARKKARNVRTPVQR